jgi:hypothetical protein
MVEQGPAAKKNIRFPLWLLPILIAVAFIGYNTIKGGTDKAARGYVSDADLRAVCQGIASSASPPYVNSAGVVHPIKMFVGVPPQYDIYGPQLPSAWEQMRDVQLVGCADRIEATLVTTCDGYENDGKPTGNKIEMFDAVYNLRVIEAFSAKPVGDPIRIASPSGRCSLVASFDGEDVTKQDYAIDSPAMIAALKRFVEP